MSSYRICGEVLFTFVGKVKKGVLDWSGRICVVAFMVASSGAYLALIHKAKRSALNVGSITIESSKIINLCAYRSVLRAIFLQQGPQKLMTLKLNLN